MDCFCESLSLREKHNVKVFENRVLKKERDEGVRNLRNLRNDKLRNLNSHKMMIEYLKIGGTSSMHTGRTKFIQYFVCEITWKQTNSKT
jgi:hypothetical protein